MTATSHLCTAPQSGRTTRMLQHAIDRARQGHTAAIIAVDARHRAQLFAALRHLAQSQRAGWVVGAGDRGGPAGNIGWVVGAGDRGGPAGNIEVYSITGHLVAEPSPGKFAIRGNTDRLVMVDHHTLEVKYQAVVENYCREW